MLVPIRYSTAQNFAYTTVGGVGRVHLATLGQLRIALAAQEGPNEDRQYSGWFNIRGLQ